MREGQLKQIDQFPTGRETFPCSLQAIKQLVYDNSNCRLEDFRSGRESLEYDACSFKLNGQKTEHRSSKITPTKTGQFVTLWKRNKEGETQPYDICDDIDLVLITSKSEDKLGQFIFPKSVLLEKGVISRNGKNGKRGMRVYPPWDKTTSKQAKSTQAWQNRYFLNINGDNSFDRELAKSLLDNANTELCTV